MSPSATAFPELNHVQVQTLLGSIGAAKGFDIWIPSNDRAKLDWALTSPFRISNNFPSSLQSVREIAEEIDVIWMIRGGDRPTALYEVEHSTPIYSGLLRFNDVYLILPNVPMRYGIVSNDSRRSLFVRQLARPTFKASGLRECCTFFEYRNVFGWHQRLRQEDDQGE
jgi:type II restriction enzyme